MPARKEIEAAKVVLSKAASEYFYGYKRSKGEKCIQRLKGGKCMRGYPNEGDHQCLPPTADHYHLWIKDGEPVLFTSEPYPLTYDDIRQEVNFCETHGFEMTIRANSPHNPGSTLLIEYRRKDKP
jgi:hypothetical protein